MSKFQHTFTVRQHTPMIHFQADQEGAFLRVSELKPAFDRFLWEKVFKNDFENNYTKLVGYVCREDKSDNKNELQNQFNEDFRALDYSIEIENIKNVKSWSLLLDKGKSFPCFFATMGDSFKDDKLRLIYTKNDFEMIFTCFNSELLETIKNNFANFLCTQNFGTRQSKGFGSFTVTENGIPLVDLIENPEKGGWYFFTKNTPSTDDSYIYFKDLFQNIDNFWKKLRNGVNNNPGLLEKYVEKKYKGNFLFDKKTLKSIVDFVCKDNVEEYYKEEIERNLLKTRNFRDILGYASSTKWEYQDVELIKITKWMYNDEKKGMVSGDLERMKSPVLFKPVVYKDYTAIYIYCSPNHQYEQIMSLYKDTDKFQIQVSKSQLNVPIYLEKVLPSDFSVRKFLDYAVEQKYCNLKSISPSKS